MASQLCGQACTLKYRYAETMYKWLALFLLAPNFLWPSLAVAQQSACHGLARTQYEKLFCQLQDKGARQQLPTFESFRANSAKVQAVILKRPAKKYGLVIPKPQKNQSETSQQPRRQQHNSKDASAVSGSSANPSRAEPSHPQSPTPARVFNKTTCLLFAGHISCPGVNYQLTLNQPNHKLHAAALSPDNQFGLASFQGTQTNTKALNKYLADGYSHYINKMLEIGLGSATMSYTKFHYTFMELDKKGADFSLRFEKMYELLKQDKTSMGVKAKYHHELPESIRLCEELNDTVVVCDNGELNWVYVKQGR